MGPVRNLWSKWKALRLPWRKSFLVGSDLAGNTYWEFKKTLNSARVRRIVKTNPKTHIGDVQVTPQWHQWLRHVRQHPPSTEEQQQDLIRQAQVKHLAHLADERWANKPSYLDKPETHQPGPAMRTTDTTLHPAEQHGQPAPAKPPHPGVSNAVRSDEQAAAEGEQKKDPWAKARGGPSEDWQPESWAPAAARR